MPVSVKALVFDLGRVVLDIDSRRAQAAWASAAGIELDPLVPNYASRIQALEAFSQHERGALSDHEFFAIVRRELALDLSHEQFLSGWNDIFVGEIEGIAPLLRETGQKYPLYALSNTNAAHHARFSVLHADLLGHFRKLYLSHEMGLRKPDAEIYRAVAADIGVRPQEILFFDDLKINVEGAQACGMQAVLVRSTDDVRSALAAI